ncbi:MAG: hypothetical protein K2G35_06745 [Duncaniella sp.]|nr:hypothetical protein [Duncaniella sp.]
MPTHEHLLKPTNRAFGKFLAGNQAELFVRLFPELNSRLSKFAPGIFLWHTKGLIDIKNPDDVSKVRLMLKVIDKTPAYDFFDNLFNEANPDTVCQVIGMSPDSHTEEGVVEFDYMVKEIKTFEDAHSYFEMVSWCIVISEESFKEYTANGNRFYFCANGDWREVTCIPGMSFPHDKFGYSLIAVEMTPKNHIASVTGRWNTCAGDDDGFLSPEELRGVLGEENFAKLFS